MAHRTVRTGYRDFIERINRTPQGAPESEHLYRILQILMDAQEASLLGAVLRLPPLKRALASDQMKSRYLAAVQRYQAQEIR